MSVLPPHSITAATFEKEDPFNIEQRRRLEEFSCKFSKYLPTFDVDVLRKHLLFLKATYRVFDSIDKPFVVEDKTNDRKAPTPATRVFLSKALHRFEVWLNQVVNHRASNKPLDEDELPPLDVLIILHGYRLAPWIYDEDLNLRFPQLAKIGNFPFDNIVSALNLWPLLTHDKFVPHRFSIGAEVGRDNRGIPAFTCANRKMGGNDWTPFRCIRNGEHCFHYVSSLQK